MTLKSLETPIKPDGINQKELYDILSNIVTAVNALNTTVTNYKAIYDAHVHVGATAVSLVGSLPDTATSTVAVSSGASAFTDSSDSDLSLIS